MSLNKMSSGSHSVLLRLDLILMRLNVEYEPRCKKTNILVSDLVRHKPGCTLEEDG